MVTYHERKWLHDDIILVCFLWNKHWLLGHVVVMDFDHSANFCDHQRDLEETELDLREFICKEVNLSFAVISEHGVSNFSPSRRFCIEGKF